MSKPQPPSPHWPVRLALGLMLLAGIAWGIAYALRPIALVVSAVTGKAVRTVPGTLEVKAEYAIELKSEVGGRVS